MTDSDICICNYPKWVYDKYDKEYYAMPLSILDQSGVKKQKGDIEFPLELDGNIVKFLAVPFTEVGNRGIPVPDIEAIYHDVSVGNDIISKQFMELTWQNLDGKHYKKYDIKNHLILAGCEASETSKQFDELEGKEVLVCTNKKEIYKALHPIDEFLEKHILELESIKDKIYI